MSTNLPAPAPRPALEPSLPRLPAPTGARSTRRWLRSPLGAALVDAAPDLLRALGHAAQARGEPPAPSPSPHPGATGLTVSEVEIDATHSGLHRVVVRTASAWTVAPETPPPTRERRWPAHALLGAVGIAGLLAGLTAARRAPRWPPRDLDIHWP